MATQPAPDQADTASRAVVPLTAQRESYAILKDRAKMFAMSPLIPEQLRAGGADVAAANCLIALQMAEAMGESPLVVMQNIHVVKGKAGFAAQYMIARANASGIFKGRISWRVNRDDPKNMSVTAYAFLADTGEEVSFTCDLAMARAEGWTSNKKYETMPEVMLRYRSATFLVRFYAPDVMLGYQTSEEVDDVIAAATPAAAPLTGQMLIEQSKPGKLPEEAAAEQIETSPHNAEVVEEAEVEPVAEPEADEAEETPVEVNDAADEPHPAQAKADEIIAEINDPANNAIMDVARVLNRHELDIAAMPDYQAVRIEIAADQRRNEIRQAQAAAKAKETAQ